MYKRQALRKHHLPKGQEQPELRNQIEDFNLMITQSGQKSKGGLCKMTFPMNEDKFIESWLSALNEPDEGDREQATATVQTINRAYYAGLEDGRKEAAICRE